MPEQAVRRLPRGERWRNVSSLRILTTWRTWTVVGWLAAAVGLLVPFAVVLGHIEDAYRLDHASGVWLALGDWAEHGTIVPPLHAGEYFAGTRYMPLPIALLGLLAHLTGNLVAAGRLFTVVGMVMLLLAVYKFARVLRAPALLSALSMGLLVATPAMTQGIIDVRNDTLSVAMGLVALMLVHPVNSSSRRWLVAGVIAALAMSWKISEVWPLVGLACYGYFGQRRRQRSLRDRVGPLAVGFAGAGVLLTLLSILVTGGRFLSVMAATLLGGEDSVFAVLQWVPRLIDQGFVNGTGAVLPVIVFGWVSSVLIRAASGPLPYAIVAAAAVTAAVYVDRGAESNHLTALIALGFVGALGAVSSWSLELKHQQVLVLTAVALVAATSTATWLLPLRTVVNGEHPAFYAAATTAAGPVLTEDPTVSVVAGDLPVVSDPFAFRRLALKHPDWAEELDDRIESGSFSQIVLLADPTRTEPDWYEQKHFGRATISAICHSYHSTGEVADGKYETFAPGAGAIPSDSVCARALY